VYDVQQGCTFTVEDVFFKLLEGKKGTGSFFKTTVTIYQLKQYHIPEDESSPLL
jgi:hypothetical protein